MILELVSIGACCVPGPPLILDALSHVSLEGNTPTCPYRLLCFSGYVFLFFISHRLYYFAVEINAKSTIIESNKD